ncbi:MAG: hypothetical protein V4501_06330 [Pseudomonadota bacterium]
MRSMEVGDIAENNLVRAGNYKQLYLIIPTLLVILCCLYLQKNFLNSDSAYLLYACNAMLHGGDYLHNFFETNPPLILYIYAPVCLLANIFDLNIIVVFKAYILLLCSLSVWVSYYIFTKIAKEPIIRYSVFFTLLLVTFLFPLMEFGQREHIAVLFITPYLFAAALTAQKNSLPKSRAILIGLFAGLGFSLKPFFLVPLCLCELYLILKSKKLFGWVRAETILILSVMISYLYTVFHFYPDYIHTILPLVRNYYYPGIHKPWQVLFGNYYCIYCLSIFCASWFLYKKNNLNELTKILILAQTGFITAYFLGGTTWFYHLLPAICYSILLITFLLTQTLLQWRNENRINFSLNFSVAMGIVFVFACSFMSNSQVNLIANENWPDFIVAIKLWLVLSLSIFATIEINKNKNLAMLATASAVISLLYFTTNNFFVNSAITGGDPLYLMLNYFVIGWLAINLIIIALALVKVNFNWIALPQKILVLIPFFYAVYFFPINYNIMQYQGMRSQNKLENSLIEYINNFPNTGGVYCFSVNNSSTCFPLVTYTHRDYSNRYPSFWWMNIITNDPLKKSVAIDTTNFINSIAEDLHRNHPQWIIIDAPGIARLARGFNIFKYFSTNKDFLAEWQHYKLKKQFYTKAYVIYEREKSAKA